MAISLMQIVSDGRLEHLKPEDYLCHGSFSVIYRAGEGRIRRLSSCTGSHHALTLGSQLGLAVPVCYRDFGSVAEQKKGAFVERIWLAELEQLQPLDADSIGYRQVLAICEALGGEDLYENPTLSVLPLDRLLELDVAPALKRTVVAMIAHAIFVGGDLDLNTTNFMQRPATGEVLVTDLVSSGEAWDNHDASDLNEASGGLAQMFGGEMLDNLLAG